MVIVPHKMVRLERMLDHRGVRLWGFTILCGLVTGVVVPLLLCNTFMYTVYIYVYTPPFIYYLYEFPLLLSAQILQDMMDVSRNICHF